MTDLVVYYSRTNNTKKVAQIISENKNADIVEVKDNKERSGKLNFLTSAVSMMFNRNTNISYEHVNLNGYDTIYIGSPVWTSGPTPAIIEFIKENDFTNKNIVTFATYLSNNGEKTTNKMNELIKENGGNIVKSFSFASKSNMKELTLEEIKDL